MKFLLIIITLLFTLNSCGIYQPSDARKVPPDAKERVKNLEEGKGLRLGSLLKEKITFNLLVQIQFGEPV